MNHAKLISLLYIFLYVFLKAVLWILVDVVVGDGCVDGRRHVGQAYWSYERFHDLVLYVSQSLDSGSR